MDNWRFASIVWRWLWLIILLTAVAGASAYVVSTTLPKQYQSEARVLVGSLTEPNIDQLQAHQQLAQVYAEVATTTPVMDRVIQQLGWSLDAQGLAAQLEVRAPVGDAIIRVIGTASSPTDAALLANAVADQIVQLGVRPGVQQPSLATVIQPAVRPNGASSPRLLVNALIASALGLFVGVGVALLIANRPAGPSAARAARSEPGAEAPAMPSDLLVSGNPSGGSATKEPVIAIPGTAPWKSNPSAPKTNGTPPKRSIRLWSGEKEGP